MFIKKIIDSWYSTGLEKSMALFVYICLKITKKLFNRFPYLKFRIDIYVLKIALILEWLSAHYLVMWINHYKNKKWNYVKTLIKMNSNCLCPLICIEVYKRMCYPNTPVIYPKAGIIAQAIQNNDPVFPFPLWNKGSKRGNSNA